MREIIKREAVGGSLTDENGKIPTENELAEMFNVSRVTVRAALKHLENQGILTRKRGRGTFYNANEVEKWTGHLMGFSETIETAGFKPGAKTLCGKISDPAPTTVRKNLELEKAWELKRVRLANETTIALEHSYFPIDIGIEFEKQNLDDLLVYRYMERELRVMLHKGRQIISAVNASKELAEILHISEGDALIYVERVTCTLDQRPVEFLTAYYRPDYFQYTVQLTR